MHARGFSGLHLTAPSEPKNVDGRVVIAVQGAAAGTAMPAFFLSSRDHSLQVLARGFCHPHHPKKERGMHPPLAKRGSFAATVINVSILQISISERKRKHATREHQLSREKLIESKPRCSAFARSSRPALAGWHASTLPAIHHKPNSDRPMQGC